MLWMFFWGGSKAVNCDQQLLDSWLGYGKGWCEHTFSRHSTAFCPGHYATEVPSSCWPFRLNSNLGPSLWVSSGVFRWNQSPDIVIPNYWRLSWGKVSVLQHSHGTLSPATQDISCQRCHTIIGNFRLDPILSHRLQALNDVWMWKQCHPLWPASVKVLVEIRKGCGNTLTAHSCLSFIPLCTIAGKR